MAQTLQEHYNAIKSGKGNKAQFLRQARSLFPQYLNQYSDFDTATNVLKSKQIISEAAGGVISHGFNVYDWKKILEAKAEEKETSKEVKDALVHAFQPSDMKNVDNINFNEIMKGFFAEMYDEKNKEKTGDEIKAIVVKNLAKDPLYYTKNGNFSTMGVGYVDEAPGLGKNTQPTDKKATVLGGNDEVNSESDIVKNSLVGSAKKNVQDTLGNKEAKTSDPKKVKEMPVAAQNSSGVKKMATPGAEKRIKLKEGIQDVEEAHQMMNIGSVSGGEGGKRFVPKELPFSSQLRKKFGEHIVFNSANGTLYISQILFNNLTKGGSSQPDLKRNIMDIPQPIKQILNKSENYGPVIKLPKEYKTYLPLQADVKKATEDKFNKAGTKQYWAAGDLLIPNLNVQENSINENYDDEFLDAAFDIILKYTKDPDEAERELEAFNSRGFEGFSDALATNLERDEEWQAFMNPGIDPSSGLSSHMEEQKLRSIIRNIIKEELDK